MSAELATTASAAGDDPITRVARWVITKVWLGCLLSAGYALGHTFGWPEALLTIAAASGAAMLGLASLGLPQWTIEHERYGVGIVVVDVGMRVVVWLGLTMCAVSLLISAPAVGAAGGALWLNTAVRTFGPGLRARWGRRRRRSPAASRSSGRSRVPASV